MAITAYLYYQDVRSALKWLTKAFGFKRYGPSNERAGKIVHAAMEFRDGIVMMGDPGPKYSTSRRTMHRTHCLHVDVDDVDTHCAKARRAGARIITEPEDTPYGDRRYGAEDPEGHHWYFAQSLRRTRGRRRG